MTGVGECGVIRHALGVYILGAISPPDRSTVEHHLARCADCRAELAGLAALPGRLGSVPAADITRMAGDERGGAGRGERPPDVPLQTLLDRAARVRRRLRWRRIAIAVAAVVIVGGGAVCGIEGAVLAGHAAVRAGGAMGGHSHRQRPADGHVRHGEVPDSAVGTRAEGAGQRDLPGHEV